tara:strand:- start:474 stop:1430 length:957 start_codon:yes stop_codon:yes gene_type:complete
MKILYHLGYPRTGSTFLQKNIFPEHKDINLIGPKNYKNWNDVKITQNELNKIADNYTETGILNEKNYLDFFDQRKLNVISSEKYVSYLNLRNNFKDIKFFNKLLQNKHKDIEIYFLVVLRNQYDLIKSLYFHAYPIYSEALGIKDFEKLIKCFNKNKESNREIFQFLLFADSFNFYKLYNNLSTNFKNPKIKFLFYEDFKLNRENFISEFVEFLNLDKQYTKSLFSDEIVNKGVSNDKKIRFSSKLRYKLSENNLVRSIKNFIPRSIKNFILKNTFSSITISKKENQEYQKIIQDYYRESNEKFFKEAKISTRYNNLY